MTAEQRAKVEAALYWSGEIGCCSDKERYALRVWDLLGDLGMRWDAVPAEVVAALKDLMNWEDCAPACGIVEAYLQGLLRLDDAAGGD